MGGWVGGLDGFDEPTVYKEGGWVDGWRKKRDSSNLSSFDTHRLRSRRKAHQQQAAKQKKKKEEEEEETTTPQR